MANELRELLTGSVLRAIAGIRDVGEAVWSVVSSDTDAGVTSVNSDRKDIWVRCKEVLSEYPRLARLFVPMNMLFRLPRSGDSVMVVRGQDSDGPGAAMAFHGDCGTNSTVPTWLSESRSGISIPETLRLESTTGDAELIGDVVYLGETGLSANDGVVHGTGIDPFTGLSYAFLGNASSVVRAKK